MRGDGRGRGSPGSLGTSGEFGGHLEPSWDGLESSWRRVESYVEPSWAILHDLGGHLGLFGALLEPSYAILGDPTPRETVPPGPGGGGIWGRGNPLPEGE